MPSAKKRLPLTLPPELEAALADLADAADKPVATVTVELLLDLAPQIHNVAKLLRVSKAGKKAAARQVLTHMIGDAAAEMVAVAQPDLFAPAKRAKKRSPGA